MTSTLAPETSTIRRLILALVAVTAATALAAPTATAAATDCAPGTGGAGAAIGVSDGFIIAWNCASVHYDTSGNGEVVTADALGTTTSFGA